MAGGLLVTQPAYKDWQKVVASDFAGWHEVCSIHAEGSFAAQKMMLLAEAPSKDYKSKAREIVGLDG